MKRYSLTIALLCLYSVFYCDIGHQSPYNRTSPSYLKTTSGLMPMDETWSGEILLTGDILIPEGVTLTIVPGTNIKMTAHSDDLHWGGEFDESDTSTYGSVMISFLIYGSVTASGTEDAPITFTPDKSLSDTMDWGGFELFASGHAHMEHVQYRNSYHGFHFHSRSSRIQLKNCEFRDITTHLISTDSEKLYGPVTVEDCRILSCGKTAVVCGAEHNISLKHSVFYGCPAVVSCGSSELTVEGSYFLGNQTAVIIRGGASPVIRGNQFTDQGCEAIQIDSGTPVLTQNNFSGGVCHLRMKSTVSVSAEENWWGSADSLVIESMIDHGADDPGLGMVDFSPFALSPLALDVPVFYPAYRTGKAILNFNLNNSQIEY